MTRSTDGEGLRYKMEENGKLVSSIFRGREVVGEESQEDKIRYIRIGELLASGAEYARTHYPYASDEMGSILIGSGGIVHLDALTQVVGQSLLATFFAFCVSDRFDYLSSRTVLEGTEIRRYKPFDDAPWRGSLTGRGLPGT